METDKNNFDIIIERSLELRKKYHELERIHHGNEWTIEEDALAFLTDAALVGRNTMSQQQRWPKNGTDKELAHKLGESIWWIIVLAERMNIDIKEALDKFLTETEKQMFGSQRSYKIDSIPSNLSKDIDGETNDVDGVYNRDCLFEEAARIVVMHQQGSTSLIQRKFNIGYNRAVNLMNQLEKAGVVGIEHGSKPREVYISDEYSLEKLLDSLR